MPIVQVKGGPKIRFPDSMSQDEIFSALDDLTARGEFNNRSTQPDAQAEPIGFLDSVSRAGRNVVNAGVEFAASLVDTPAIIGEFARNIIPVLNDSPPLEEMTLHKAAEWIRSFEMSNEGEGKPEGVQGFLTDTLPGMAGSAASLLSAAGIARKALPVAVSAALGGAAAQGVSGFRGARESGATLEQQFQSWMVNTGIGAASAIPISRWLSIQPNANLLSTAITEGSVNAAVGFFQQLATNIADQQIYDKDRPWMQGVGEATAGGLTIGGLMGLTMAGMAKQKPKTGTPEIKDPALNAASKVVETSNGAETAKAIAELDASREAANAKAKSDPIVDDPSHVISPESQAVLNAEQLKAELEANPIEEVVKISEELSGIKLAEEPIKPVKPIVESLSTEDKASLQAELDAELGIIEPVEIPKPIEEPKVTGRTAPTETNRVLKGVKDEIARLNKMFGNLIDTVIIQDIPDGAGIASAARSGEHKTIALDPVRLAEAERTGASIKDLVREEVIHSLQGKAVRDIWTKLGEPGEFRDYWDKHFTELANEMSDAQKEWINKIYGSELKSPIQQAVEFVRATLQERYSGRISEARYSRAKQPALTNLLNVFREFWNGFKGKKGEVGKLAKQQMQAIDKLLREGRKNVKRAEPKAKVEREPWQMTKKELEGNNIPEPEPGKLASQEGGRPKVGAWRIDTYTGELEQLQSFDPNKLETKEPEADVKNTATYKKYVDAAKRGLKAPPVTVVDADSGALQSSGRRRTMAAREAGVEIEGWRYKKLKGTHSAETHKQSIERAIREGKSVPSEVLADYPDLIASNKAKPKVSNVEVVGADVPPSKKVTPSREPGLFNSVEDILEFKAKSIEDQIDLYQRELGLTKEQAEKVNRMDRRDKLGEDDLVRVFGKDLGIKIADWFDTTPYNKLGGEFTFWGLDPRFSPEDTASIEDNGSLAMTVIRAVQGDLDAAIRSDRFLSSVIGLLRIKENGGGFKEIASAIARHARENSSSQGDAEFSFKRTSERVAALIKKTGIHFHDESKGTTRSNSTTQDVGSQALVSNVEGNQAKPAKKADAGDAKGSSDATSSPRQLETKTAESVTLPDSFQEALYSAADEIIKAMNFDGVTKEFADTFVKQALFERAERYFSEHGNLDKFSTKTVVGGLLKDFYKNKYAKKRSGNMVSLDAPLGDEGEASVADTIGSGDTASGDQTQQQRIVEVMNDHIKKLKDPSTIELLEASMERGGTAALAKKLGIPENTLRSRLKVAQKQLSRELMASPEGREIVQGMMHPDDLVNAASPIAHSLLPDESLARDIDWWSKIKRSVSPERWGYEGRLIEFANTTDDPVARGLLNKVARRLVRFYDKHREIGAKTLSPIYEVRNSFKSKAEKVSVQNEWETYHAAHEARDGGITAKQAQDDADTRVYPTLSAKAKALVDHRRATGVWSGKLQNGFNGGIGLIVKDGKKHRVFSDAGDRFYPRQFSQEIDAVLSDPDAPTNRARFAELMEELVDNNPKEFPTIAEAKAYWMEGGRESISSGDYYAGADLARGVKFPDSWHDYTLEGYIKGRESWAERAAQIWAFGQDAPAEIVKGKLVRPALMNAFDEAIRFSTAQGDYNGKLGLKTLLGQIRDDVFGTRQSHAGDEWIRNLRSLGTIRYLSAVLSSVRNVGQGIVSTAEQAGARRAVMMASKGLYDASRAVYQSVKAGQFVEPKQVEAAANIGAFQRSVTHQSFYDLDPIKPAGTAVGKAGQWLGEKLLLGQHLSEGWNRGMSAAAFGLWSRDAVRAFAHNPNSAEVVKARAQLQRWGFGLPEQAKFFSGDTEMVNRFIRTAVHEKQYGYKGDQVPALFRAPGFQLLTLFQSWGVQRTRDFTRNVWRPMFYGEKVNLPGGRTAQVRDPMPMIRFIVGSMAGTAALNWLKDEALGRKLKDPSWEEILNAGDQETSLGVKMAIGRVANDLTASGGMGLVPDYLRSAKDWTTQGRAKSLANSPAIQIASDLTDLIRAQVGREGDPRAFWRDFRDILLLRTPIAREVNDFSTHMLLFGEDAKTLFDSRQAINTGRAFIKRWTNETGRDNLLKQHSFTGGKTPNSETYDQIYENILEGDTVRAGELVNEYTNNRRDRKKLSAVQASIRGRTPLAGEARLSPQEMREFITWAKSRNPEAGAKIEGVINSYHRNVNKLGFR